MSSSFVDVSFVKNLESALRFGTPLLVQDVENLDPVLNSVLNREVRRTGGRNLIRIGNQDIDLSPTFTLYLATRDPMIAIPPDLSSRVTVVNFTMTRGSLESQALDKILKAERPDTEQRRSDLLKSQRQFRLRLRHLERELLTALNESTGSILENDKLISTLEGLKKEAADISRKMSETEAVAIEIEEVTNCYKPIAQSASEIYFLLERLGDLHHFYRFSLAFFLELFNNVLEGNPHLEGVKDPRARQTIITRDLFDLSYERVAGTLLQDDHAVLALALTQLMPSEDSGKHAHEILDNLTGSTMSVTAHDVPSFLQTAEQKQLLSIFQSGDKVHSSMSADAEAWAKLLTETQPEASLSKILASLELDGKCCDFNDNVRPFKFTFVFLF